MREINNEVITVQDCIDLKELKNVTIEINNRKNVTIEINNRKNVTIEINNGKVTGMIDGDNESSCKS